MQYFGVLAEFSDLQVLADQLHNRQAHLDKRRVGRAPAQRFNTDSSGAGEQVEKARVLNTPGENIKEGRLDAIDDWPGAGRLWPLQFSAFGRSCYHTHSLLLLSLDQPQHCLGLFDKVV